MKLLVLEDAHFSCSACAKCCHHWHVELSSEEIVRVQNLAWPSGDPLLSARVVKKHFGKTYLAHAKDEACVFLNRKTNLCRIHAEFGAEAKPLGCRLYPFQIMPTFKGEATVTGRYGCPTVRKNVGAPYTDAIAELNDLTRLMNLPEALEQATCCFLDREQVDAVCEFAATMIQGFDSNEQRTFFLFALADWLGTLDNDQLDREVLGNSLLPIKEGVESVMKLPAKKPGLLARMAFRMFLGLHLRRDEDVLDGRAGRFSRLFSMLKFVYGFGSFKGLGVIHPDGNLAQAGLFQSEISSPSTEVFQLHWQMVATKLLSLQFMGSANGNRNLLDGLRTLALVYPVTLAAAKYRAGNRGSKSVEAEDVDYAVEVIEHSFGRSQVLAHSFARSIEKLLLDPEMFVRVVRTV